VGIGLLRIIGRWKWKVYILFSEEFIPYLCGCSHDVTERLCVHNAGKVKATKNGVPWIVIYTETVGDYKEARKRELYYKERRWTEKNSTDIQGKNS